MLAPTQQNMLALTALPVPQDCWEGLDDSEEVDAWLSLPHDGDMCFETCANQQSVATWQTDGSTSIAELPVDVTVSVNRTQLDSLEDASQQQSHSNSATLAWHTSSNQSDIPSAKAAVAERQREYMMSSSAIDAAQEHAQRMHVDSLPYHQATHLLNKSAWGNHMEVTEPESGSCEDTKLTPATTAVQSSTSASGGADTRSGSSGQAFHPGVSNKEVGRFLPLLQPPPALHLSSGQLNLGRHLGVDVSVQGMSDPGLARAVDASTPESLSGVSGSGSLKQRGSGSGTPRASARSGTQLHSVRQNMKKQPPPTVRMLQTQLAELQASNQALMVQIAHLARIEQQLPHTTGLAPPGMLPGNHQAFSPQPPTRCASMPAVPMMACGPMLNSGDYGDLAMARATSCAVDQLKEAQQQQQQQSPTDLMQTLARFHCHSLDSGLAGIQECNEPPAPPATLLATYPRTDYLMGLNRSSGSQQPCIHTPLPPHQQHSALNLQPPQPYAAPADMMLLPSGGSSGHHVSSDAGSGGSSTSTAALLEPPSSQLRRLVLDRGMLQQQQRMLDGSMAAHSPLPCPMPMAAAAATPAPGLRPSGLAPPAAPAAILNTAAAGLPPPPNVSTCLPTASPFSAAPSPRPAPEGHHSVVLPTGASLVLPPPPPPTTGRAMPQDAMLADLRVQMEKTMQALEHVRRMRRELGEADP